MSVSISNTGDVRPCSHNPNVYGNILDENLEDIWSKMGSYRENAIPVICLECPSVSSCNGACRTNPLASTGRVDQPDRFLVGPTSLPEKRLMDPTIVESSILRFNGIFRWRQEGDNYSISSKKGAGNVAIVNEDLFLFTQWLSKTSPISFAEIDKNSESDAETQACKEILEVLIRKGFLSII